MMETDSGDGITMITKIGIGAARIQIMPMVSFTLRAETDRLSSIQQLAIAKSMDRSWGKKQQRNQVELQVFPPNCRFDA